MTIAMQELTNAELDQAGGGIIPAIIALKLAINGISLAAGTGSLINHLGEGSGPAYKSCKGLRGRAAAMCKKGEKANSKR